MRRLAVRRLAVRRLAVLIVLTAVVTGCGLTDRAGAGDGWPAGRTFRATSVTQHEVVRGTHIELRFGRDGELGANAGCNHISGTGRIEGGRLVVIGLGQTEMGCAPELQSQDAWLIRLLGDRPAWRLDGDELTLTGQVERLTLVDRSVLEPDRPLAGTRWVVDTIVTGDAASSVPGGASAWLEFDGRYVSGATGCGSIRGGAIASDRTIAFANVEGGGATCTSNSATLDTAVRDVLRGVVTFEIDGSVLRLMTRDQPGLTTRDPHGLGLHAG